jgi:hypothetical protein
MKENISKIYDFIIDTTITQKRVLDKKTLFGDGTMFQNDYKTFCFVYDLLLNIMIENKLINPTNYKTN